jgi:hypothetical protein
MLAYPVEIIPNRDQKYDRHSQKKTLQILLCLVMTLMNPVKYRRKASKCLSISPQASANSSCKRTIMSKARISMSKD